VWDWIQFIVIVTVFVFVPFRIGFNVVDWRSWIAVDIVTDILLWVDIALNFITSYEQEGDTVSLREDIRRMYLRSWLIPDVISVLPLDLFCLLLKYYTPVFRGNRLIRLLRFSTYFSNMEKTSSLKPTIIRLLKSIFLFFVASHCFACTFHLILLIEEPRNDVLFEGTLGVTTLSYGPVSRYFRSALWAMSVFTGYNNPIPGTMLETLFMMVVTMTGIIYTGVVIGAVGEMINKIDHSKLYFRQMVDSVQDFMDHRQLPPSLQEDVREYYNYLWKTGKALERNELLTEMPGFLKDKMNFSMNREIIGKVPLFQEYANDVVFISEIIKCLQAVIWLPNFFVVLKGEVGTEMFFISRGELNVVNEKEQVIFTLRDGGFFGEIALIYDTKRTATIVARTFCDMFILKKDDFKKVMRKFPAQYKGIQAIAKERFQKIVDDEKKREVEQAAARVKPGGETPPETQLVREASLRRKISRRQVEIGAPSEVELTRTFSIHVPQEIVPATVCQSEEGQSEAGDQQQTQVPLAFFAEEIDSQTPEHHVQENLPGMAQENPADSPTTSLPSENQRTQALSMSSSELLNNK
jgi:CRP-like cAMP-binding protein